MIVRDEKRYSVFGSSTFRGNPVTLFKLDALDDSTAMLHAARNSATEDNVFFTSVQGEPVAARFFSSTAELWLCGHGLLALSHHLFAPGTSGMRPVHAPSGSWQIYADNEGPGVLMAAQRGTEIVDAEHSMKQALRSMGISHHSLYQCPNGVWVALLHDMAELLRIEANKVAALPIDNIRPGALITALRLQDTAYGFRYFAPWHGKLEDSGTGSAHCYLAPLLARRRQPELALQFSPAGVAEARICLRDDGVALSGRVDAAS